MKLAKKIEMKTKSTQLFIEDYRITHLAPIAKQIQAINTGHMIAAGNLAVRNKVVEAVKKIVEVNSKKQTRRGSVAVPEISSPGLIVKKVSSQRNKKGEPVDSNDAQHIKNIKKISLEARPTELALVKNNIQVILTMFETSQGSLKKFEKAKILQQLLRAILASGRDLQKIEKTAELMLRVVNQDFGVVFEKLTKPDMVLNVILTFKSSRLAYYQQLIVLCTICIAKLLDSIKRAGSDRSPSLKNLHQGIADCVMFLKKIESGSEISHRLQTLTLDLIDLFDVTKLNAEDLENTVYLKEFAKKREGYFAREDAKYVPDEDDIKFYLEKEYAEYLKSEEHARLETYIISKLPQESLTTWTTKPKINLSKNVNPKDEIFLKQLKSSDLKPVEINQNVANQINEPTADPTSAQPAQILSKVPEPLSSSPAIIVKNGKVVFRSKNHPDHKGKLENPRIRTIQSSRGRSEKVLSGRNGSKQIGSAGRKILISDVGYATAASIWAGDISEHSEWLIHTKREYKRNNSHRVVSHYGTLRVHHRQVDTNRTDSSKTARFLSNFRETDTLDATNPTVSDRRVPAKIESELLKRVKEKVMAFHKGDHIERIKGFKLHLPTRKTAEYKDPWMESAAELSPHNPKPKRILLGSSRDSNSDNYQQELIGGNLAFKEKFQFEKSGSEGYMTDKLVGSSDDLENSSDALKIAEGNQREPSNKPKVFVLGTEAEQPETSSPEQVSKKGLELKLHLVEAASSRKSQSRRSSVRRREESSDDGFGEIDFRPIKGNIQEPSKKPKFSNALSIEIPSVQQAVMGSAGSSKGLLMASNNLVSPGKSARELKAVPGEHLSKVSHLVSPRHPDKPSSRFIAKSPQQIGRLGSAAGDLLKSPQVDKRESRRNSGVLSPPTINPPSMGKSNHGHRLSPNTMFKSHAAHSLQAGLVVNPLHRSTARMGSMYEERTNSIHEGSRGSRRTVRKSSRFEKRFLEIEPNEEYVLKYSGLMRKLALVELEHSLRMLRESFNKMKFGPQDEVNENFAATPSRMFSGYTPSPIHHRSPHGSYNFTGLYGNSSKGPTISEQHGLLSPNTRVAGESVYPAAGKGTSEYSVMARGNLNQK